MILFCETCREFFNESRMVSETQCDKCEAIEWLKPKGGDGDEALSLKKQKELGDECAPGEANVLSRRKVLPLAGERESKTEALAGRQLMLEL